MANGIMPGGRLSGRVAFLGGPSAGSTSQRSIGFQIAAQCAAVGLNLDRVLASQLEAAEPPCLGVTRVLELTSVWAPISIGTSHLGQVRVRSIGAIPASALDGYVRLAPALARGRRKEAWPH
jgi:hypothetical protein